MKLKEVIGENIEEEFMEFDYTIVQETLNEVSNSETPSLAHAEYLQHKCLITADILAGYLGKLIKYSSYLEAEINSIRNKYALEFTLENNGKVTGEMRQYALKSCPEAKKYEKILANLKGGKSVIEKRFDLLIKAHHLYKDIAARMNKIIPSENNVPSGNWM